eukprot:TRINITY_DN4625_c0_g1_i1.p1 TRINITY_DN4625_c0_g1~~TRINITY_DN4625_c0_g1_i1.p1  ORF type:complete len:321 (+),score=70.45 TRINITY_DN4625_c0_g1_i1:194-1156(+)
MREVDDFLQAHKQTKDKQPYEDILAHNPRLIVIRDRIEEILETLPTKEAFVRLSTLSPKDTTRGMIRQMVSCLEGLLHGRGLKTAPVDLDAETSHQLTKKEMREVQSTPSSLPIEVACLNKACVLVSKITSGDAALQMMFASDRVQKTLEHRREQEKKFRMSIVIRSWKVFEPEMEFRCFVKNGSVTAITHYYEFLYVEEIVQQKSQLESVMLAYLNEKVIPKLPDLSEYACDLAILPDSSVMVIELNPFAENTSSALFDWKDEKDAQILNGESDFEFRILTEPPPDGRARLGMFGVMLQMLRPLPDEPQIEDSRRCNLM